MERTAFLFPNEIDGFCRILHPWSGQKAIFHKKSPSFLWNYCSTKIFILQEAGDLPYGLFLWKMKKKAKNDTNSHFLLCFGACFSAPARSSAVRLPVRAALLECKPSQPWIGRKWFSAVINHILYRKIYYYYHEGKLGKRRGDDFAFIINVCYNESKSFPPRRHPPCGMESGMLNGMCAEQSKACFARAHRRNIVRQSCAVRRLAAKGEDVL